MERRRLILLPLNPEEVVELDGRPHLAVNAHSAQCLAQLLERESRRASAAEPPSALDLPRLLPPRQTHISLAKVWIYIRDHEPVEYFQLLRAFDAERRSLYLNRALRRLERDGDIFRSAEGSFTILPERRVAPLRLIG